MGVMEKWLREAGGFVGREVADLAGIEGLGDAITTPVAPLLGLLTVEDDVEKWIDKQAQRVPGLKQLDQVLDWSVSPSWEQAAQTGSWKDLRAALDSTGNDVEQIGRYLGGAVVKSPGFLKDWGVDVASRSGRLVAAIGTGDVGEIGSAFFEFGKSVLGPIFYIASEPIEDVHGYQGEIAYKYAVTGSWDVGAGIGFNLAAEYIKDHPEERDAIKNIYNNGYDSNGDGQPDFTGGRAVWEYIIGKQNRATKIFFEVVNDPWNATVILSFGQLAAKGAAKAMMAGAPRAGETMMTVAKALGVAANRADIIADLPLWATWQATKKVAPKVAPELTARAGDRIARSLPGRLFQQSDQSKAMEGAADTADALAGFAGDGNWVKEIDAVMKKHGSRPGRPPGYRPEPAGEGVGYRAVNLGVRAKVPVYIVGPDGMPVPGFDYYQGKGRDRRAAAAVTALNNLLERSKGGPPLGARPSPRLMTTPELAQAPDPGADGPLLALPQGERYKETTPDVPDDAPEVLALFPDEPIKLDVEGNTDKINALPSRIKNQDYASPNEGSWYEFQPKKDNDYPLSMAARRLEDARADPARADEAARLEEFFRQLGIETQSGKYNLMPEGIGRAYETRRRNLAAQRYENGDEGGWSRKVINEAIYARQHFVFEIAPLYREIVGGDILDMWKISPRAQKWDAARVRKEGSKIYQGVLKPAQEGEMIRDLIDTAIFRTGSPDDDLAAAAARAVLGRHGWEDSSAGMYVPRWGFKHRPDPQLGFSGGVTRGEWSAKSVRAAEPYVRDEMSPMDWIGTMRAVVRGGPQSLASPPDVTDVGRLAAPTAPPAPLPRAIDPELAAAAPQLSNEQVTAASALIRNMDRAISAPGETQLDDLTFERGVTPAPSGPDTLSQTGEPRTQAIHNIDALLDPAQRREMRLNAMQRPEIPDNPLLDPAVAPVKDDIIAAMMADDNAALERLIQPFPPTVKSRLRMFLKNLQEADANLTAPGKKPDKRGRVGSRTELAKMEQAELAQYVPDLKTWEDVRAVMSQPAPQWAIDADQRYAEKLYPDLSPEEAMDRLVAEGRNKFSKFDEPVEYRMGDGRGGERPVWIPGGIEDGKFSYWELAVIEAQSFNPAMMPMGDRAKLYSKMFRSTIRDEGYDPIDLWTRLAFGVMSSSTDLHNNMRMVSAIRPRNIEELREMAAWSRRNRHLPELVRSRKYFEEVELPRRRAAGETLDPETDWYKAASMAVTENNIPRAIDIAGKVVLDMDLQERGILPRSFFTQQPGEPFETFVTRVAATNLGLGIKTANFGMMLGDPSGWPYGTMDIWMMRWLRDMFGNPETTRLLRETLDENGVPLIESMPARYKDTDGNLRMPESDYEVSGTKPVKGVDPDTGEIIDTMPGKVKNAAGKSVQGKVAKDKDPNGEKYYTDPRVEAVEKGEDPNLRYGERYFPVSGLKRNEAGQRRQLGITLMDAEYADSTQALLVMKKLYEQEYPEVADMSVGGFQWFIWDGIRGSFEAHFMAFPDLALVEKLPLDEWRQLDRVAYLQKDMLESSTDVVINTPIPGTASEKTGGKLMSKETRVPAPAVIGGRTVIVDPTTATMRQLDSGMEISKGQIEITNERAVIRLFEKADVSTVVHESIHFFRRRLDDIDMATVNRFVGADDAESWTVEQEEMLARAWERYLSNPKYADSLPDDVRSLFDQFTRWMKQIYTRLKGSEIDVRLTPEVEDFFGRITAGKTRDEWTALKNPGAKVPDVDTNVPVTGAFVPNSGDEVSIGGGNTPAPPPTNPSEVRVPSTKNPAASDDPEAGVGFVVEGPVDPEEVAARTDDAAVTPGFRRTSVRKDRAPLATDTKVLLARSDEGLDVGDFNTWTPLFFAATARVINRENFENLPRTFQNILLDGGVLVRGANGKLRLDMDALDTARREMTYGVEEGGYEPMAQVVLKKKWAGKDVLYQKSGKPRIVGNVPAPSRPRIEPDVEEAVKTGRISRADADLLMSPMPDEQGGELVYDVYLDALADGLAPREAIRRVTTRLVAFGQLDSKAKAMYLETGKLPPVTRTRRILGKMATFNRVAREGQMYNVAKGVTRPTSDFMGNTMHMAISGNNAGLIRQLRSVPTAARIIIRRPEDAHKYLDKASSPVFKGLDMDMPESVLNAYGASQTKWGFGSEDLVLAQIAEKYQLPWHKGKIITSMLASPRVQAMGNAADAISKKNLAEAVANDAFLDAGYRFMKEIDKTGRDGGKVIKDSIAAARKRTGDPNVTAFAPEDVRKATGDDAFAQQWARERDAIRDKIKSETRRVLFAGSPQRNYERALGQAFYYFFWQSRSLNLAARSAATNPLVLSSYIKLWEGLAAEAERNDYPRTFVGTLRFWGDPRNPLGWFGLTNAVGILIPGFMMSEWYDLNRPNDDDRSWFEQFSTIAPTTAIFGGALAALGMSDEVPAMIGSRQIENLVLATLDWGDAQGMDLTNGQPKESIVRHVEEFLLTGANGVLREFGAKRYEPYQPSSGKKDTIKSVIWQRAAEDWGQDVEQWTPENWRELSEAMTVVDEGFGESQRAAEAYREWATVMITMRAANVVLPGGAIPRYSGREQARTAAKSTDGVPGDPQASLQRDIIVASPGQREVEMQEQEARAWATPAQRAANDYYNLLVYRLPDDLTAFPDDMTFPTSVGPITAATLRAMPVEQRRAVAEGILAFAGIDDEQRAYLDTMNAAKDSGQFPEFTAYKDYQSYVRDYKGGARAFRTYARRANPAYADAETDAAARWKKKNPGGDVEAFLDGWIFSSRAYAAIRNRPASMYDSQPEGFDMGPLTSGGGGGAGFRRTSLLDQVDQEAAELQSGTTGSTNMLYQGLGYRGSAPMTETRQYLKWLETNTGSARDWWQATRGSAPA